MEDAATAEISRAQIWQWIKNGVVLDTGFRVTKEYFLDIFNEEMEKLGADNLAREIFEDLCVSDQLEDFLTTKCYNHI